MALQAGGVRSRCVQIGGGSFMQYGRGYAELSLALKRAVAGHHLVEQRAQRENVAVRVRLFAIQLLPAYAPFHEPHSTLSFRGFADGFGHFVSSLDVVELRLQEQSLGVKFVGSGGLRLRTQGSAFFHLLCDDAAGFGAQS